jgi:hypothetical protein
MVGPAQPNLKRIFLFFLPPSPSPLHEQRDAVAPPPPSSPPPPPTLVLASISSSSSRPSFGCRLLLLLPWLRPPTPPPLPPTRWRDLLRSSRTMWHAAGAKSPQSGSSSGSGVDFDPCHRLMRELTRSLEAGTSRLGAGRCRPDLGLLQHLERAVRRSTYNGACLEMSFSTILHNTMKLCYYRQIQRLTLLHNTTFSQVL